MPTTVQQELQALVYSARAYRRIDLTPTPIRRPRSARTAGSRVITNFRNGVTATPLASTAPPPLPPRQYPTDARGSSASQWFVHRTSPAIADVAILRKLEAASADAWKLQMPDTNKPQRALQTVLAAPAHRQAPAQMPLPDSNPPEIGSSPRPLAKFRPMSAPTRRTPPQPAAELCERVRPQTPPTRQSDDTFPRGIDANALDRLQCTARTGRLARKDFLDAQICDSIGTLAVHRAMPAGGGVTACAEVLAAERGLRSPRPETHALTPRVPPSWWSWPAPDPTGPGRTAIRDPRIKEIGDRKIIPVSEIKCLG